MKILIFHPALAPYKLDFFNALSDRFDLTVVLQAHNLQSQKFDQEKLTAKARFKIAYMPHTLIAGGRKISWGYRGFIRSGQPDIVVGSEFGPNVLAPYLLRCFSRKKFALWTMTDDSMDTTTRCRRVRRAFRQFFAPRLDGVLFANADVREWYANHFPLRASAVAPIIADERVLRSMIASRLDLSLEWERQLGLEQKRRVLFVGRFHAVKNLHRLLEAFPLVRSDAVLILVGSGDDRPALEEDVRRLGLGERVIFAGRWEQPELYQWYQLADILVLPSVSETFGAVVGEALQSGCPVVCSSVAGAASMIRPGDNGEVVDPYSPAEIAAAIETVLSREAAGPKTALRPSRMTHTLDEYMNLFTRSLYESVRHADSAR